MLGLGTSIVTSGAANDGFLLDDYSGAAAAYSLRLLSSTYEGSAIRVRRESNDAEQDIGFNSNGDLDISALATFCAGTNGFVKTWYDQSGNGNHVSNSNNVKQAKIYDGTDGLVTDNGNPALDFDDDFYEIDETGYNIDTISTFVTGRFYNTGTGNQMMFALSDDTTNARYYAPMKAGVGHSFGYASQYNAVDFFSDTDLHLFTGIAGATIGNFSGFRDGVLEGTATRVSYGMSGTVGIGGMRNSFAFEGTIQEVIIYDSDQSSNRSGIETNINSEYAIYGQSPTGLLADYSGAAAAYSLRQLISTENYAVAVRRDSDDAVLPIGFVGGELDTTALDDFCSGTDGFVAVWFDQSGNGNHAKQATPSDQPKIYDSNTGVVTENGKPAIMSLDSTNLSFTLISDIQSVFLAGALTAVGQKKNYILGYSNGYDYHSGNNVNAFLDPGLSASDVRDGANYRNGTLTNFATTAQTVGRHLLSMIHLDATGRANQITRDRSNTRSWDGPLYEIIIYNSDQSSNRTGIETNINSFYSIF